MKLFCNSSEIISHLVQLPPFERVTSTLLGNKVPLRIQNSYPHVHWSSKKFEQKKLPIKLLTFSNFLDSKEAQFGTSSKNFRQNFENYKLCDHQYILRRNFSDRSTYVSIIPALEQKFLNFWQRVSWRRTESNDHCVKRVF